MKLLASILMLAASVGTGGHTPTYKMRHALIGLRLLYARVKIELTCEPHYAPLY